MTRRHSRPTKTRSSLSTVRRRDRPQHKVHPGCIVAALLTVLSQFPAVAAAVRPGSITEDPATQSRVQAEAVLDLAAVQNFEQRLKASGFAPSRTDGVIDSRTRAAIRAYQSARGLWVTGDLDEGTSGRALSRAWRRSDRDQTAVELRLYAATAFEPAAQRGSRRGPSSRRRPTHRRGAASPGSAQPGRGAGGSNAR